MSETATTEAQAQQEERGFFQHTGHVQLAWLYLRKHSLLDAIARVTEALRMFAVANNAEQLYNETLTWAYMLLINERMVRLGPAHEWEEFKQTNPDLFDWKNSIVKKLYREETLNSDLAKRVFVMPDLPRA